MATAPPMAESHRPANIPTLPYDSQARAVRFGLSHCRYSTQPVSPDVVVMDLKATPPL